MPNGSIDTHTDSIKQEPQADLLPCPFCGSNKIGFGGRSFHYVTCHSKSQDCHISRRAVAFDDYDKDDLVYRWNKRAGGVWYSAESAPLDGKDFIAILPGREVCRCRYSSFDGYFIKCGHGGDRADVLGWLILPKEPSQ